MPPVWDLFRQSGWSLLARPRDALGTGLGIVGFGFLCLFHGVATDLVLFAYGIFALLLALFAVGPARISARLSFTPRDFGFGVAWLLALIASYTFSISKDGSFVPSLVLAVPVVGFVLGAALAEHARHLFGLVSLTVLGLAGWSTANLLVRSDLAQMVMIDVNNYGTLLYLIAIPWIHRYLVAGRRLSRVYQGLSAGAMFVVFVALLGTSSRACLLILGASFAVWWGLTLRRRLDASPMLVCSSALLLAYVAILLVVDVSAVDRFSEVGVNTGVGVRLALIGSAVEMLDPASLAAGVGVFAFPLLYRTWRTPDDLTTSGLFVHNDYLQFLLEGGLPLFVLACVFFVVLVKRCVKGLFASRDSPGFDGIGLHLALCAAAFHALVNFVYYTPALGFVIGLMVALSLRAGSNTEVEPTKGGATDKTGAAAVVSRMGFGVVAAGLAFGSASFFYLAVDTLSAGVFGGQRGIPFASIYRQDPDRMLEFAVNAQKINRNRGLPALVEAVLLERKINIADGLDEFAERALAAHERAVEIDPWNGSAWLGMAVFLESHPQLAPRTADARSPEALVLASLEIDPLFVPGIDWLVERYERTGRMQQAYELVRRNIFPWLRFLGTEQPEAAVTYFRFLRARAEQYGDDEVITALEMLRRA